MQDRVIQFLADYRNDALWAFAVALIAFTAFGVGRATAPMPEKSPLVVENFPIAANIAEIGGGERGAEANANPAGKFVASKNGTKYYFPSCSGTNRIKEENKVWFVSEEEARENGYEPAKNCPGL